MFAIPLELTMPDSPLPLSMFDNPKQADDFICTICSDVANPKNAVEHVSCGHLFCKSCLDSWVNISSSCPFCKQSMHNCQRSIRSKNKIVYRYLSALKIKCPTTSTSGTCQWAGPWADLASHLKTCERAIVLCSNGCQHKCTREVMGLHESTQCTHRMINCKLCNGCVKFKDLEEHFKVCTQNEDAELPCKYSYLGCTFKGNKSERARHEAIVDKAHLELAVEHIKKLSLDLSKFEEEKKKIELQESWKKKPCKVSVHSHPLRFVKEDNGWSCDGRNLEGGCKSGITGFYQTTGMERYRCRACDFDLCRKCLEAYILND